MESSITCTLRADSDLRHAVEQRSGRSLEEVIRLHLSTILFGLALANVTVPEPETVGSSSFISGTVVRLCLTVNGLRLHAELTVTRETEHRLGYAVGDRPAIFLPVPHKDQPGITLEYL